MPINGPVTQDLVVWAARRTIAMHDPDQDGPTGRCKDCPDQDPQGCRRLHEARLDLATAGLPHPHQ